MALACKCLPIRPRLLVVLQELRKTIVPYLRGPRAIVVFEIGHCHRAWRIGAIGLFEKIDERSGVFDIPMNVDQ